MDHTLPDFKAVPQQTHAEIYAFLLGDVSQMKQCILKSFSKYHNVFFFAITAIFLLIS